MISKNISMPHPVLGIPDDMAGSFNVSFKLQIDRASKNYVFKNLSIDISNPYINSLYEDNLLEYIIKIRCIPTYKSWIFRNKEIAISEDDVDILLEIESYLVAKETLLGYGDGSFNEIFDNQVFNLLKGDIVGLTGTTKIPIRKENEKMSMGTIFKFSKIDPTSEDQELRFDFDDDQILIKYPRSNSTYDPITFLFDTNQGFPLTAINFYVIPALTEAFNILNQEGKELYETKRWAIVLENSLPAAQRVEDAFINAQKSLKVGIPVNIAFDEILKSKNID